MSAQDESVELAVDAGAMVAALMIGSRGSVTGALRLLHDLEHDEIRDIGERALLKAYEAIATGGR